MPVDDADIDRGRCTGGEQVERVFDILREAKRPREIVSRSDRDDADDRAGKSVGHTGHAAEGLIEGTSPPATKMVPYPSATACEAARAASPSPVVITTSRWSTIPRRRALMTGRCSAPSSLPAAGLRSVVLSLIGRAGGLSSGSSHQIILAASPGDKRSEPRVCWFFISRRPQHHPADSSAHNGAPVRSNCARSSRAFATVQHQIAILLPA